MPWLNSLGEVTHNWQAAWMKFRWENQEIMLQGLSSGQRSHTSLHHWLNSGGQLPQPHIPSTLGASNQLTALLHQDHQHTLQQLSARFEGIFQNPTSLSPILPHDHCINLIQNHDPICVRLYRYPHLHKIEIENQVTELLSLGMIRPSKSAYSSPVILVRKKDAFWRMCVDY